MRREVIYQTIYRVKGERKETTKRSEGIKTSKSIMRVPGMTKACWSTMQDTEKGIPKDPHHGKKRTVAGTLRNKTDISQAKVQMNKCSRGMSKGGISIVYLCCYESDMLCYSV